jgi:hypothetical protein
MKLADPPVPPEIWAATPAAAQPPIGSASGSTDHASAAGASSLPGPESERALRRIQAVIVRQLAAGAPAS